jgi:hypothetical protein
LDRYGQKIDRIVPSDVEFSSDAPPGIELNHINTLGQINIELESRLEAVNLEIPSALTSRELMSPLLITKP